MVTSQNHQKINQSWVCIMKTLTLGFHPPQPPSHVPVRKALLECHQITFPGLCVLSPNRWPILILLYWFFLRSAFDLVSTCPSIKQMFTWPLLHIWPQTILYLSSQPSTYNILIQKVIPFHRDILAFIQGIFISILSWWRFQNFLFS